MTYHSLSQCLLDLVDIGTGHPALGDETLLGDVDREHVQRVEDGLELEQLDSPLGHV